MAKECGHLEFYDLKKELEKKGGKFTALEMKKLCFADLFIATIGNAGDQAGRSEDAEAEQEVRLKRFKGLTADELDKATYCDSHENYAAFQMLSKALGLLRDEEADPEILLYRNMTRLRGSWSGGRSSPFLKEIYRLIEVCKQRGELPIAWLAAVKKNADKFDGHFNDGRIMRDGAYYLPEELQKAFGMPKEMTEGCSGNLAKMMGAQPVTEGGYRGSYDELMEKVLTPSLRIQYMREDEFEY